QWEKSQQATDKLHNCSRKFRPESLSNLPTSGRHNNGFDLTISSLPPPGVAVLRTSWNISRSIYPD
ncbi:hypothetical protein KR032_004511, partial [Drosophila birchii]